MHRLLFVDDEPRVLDSLRRQLFSRRNEWELHFATSGEAALDTLSRTEFDAIVTDIRMPGMDGATLLEEVRTRYPDMVRVVLSGHCDSDVAARALSIAHRYLSKPCDADTLKSTIERAMTVRGGMENPRLRSLLHRVGDLPHLPDLCTELERTLSDPEPSFERISALLSRDPALVARVLQFANSAYFSGSERTMGIDAAVARLGTHVLRSLVLSTVLRDCFTPATPVEGFDARAEQRHAIETAAIAREIGRQLGTGDEAFTAALLHDVGKLVLAARLPEEYGGALRGARESGSPVHGAEREHLGATHAEVGAYLLALWGLPQDLVAAVREHHDPIARLPDPLDLPGMVVVANFLHHELVKTANDSMPAADARWVSWREAASAARRDA